MRTLIPQLSKLIIRQSLVLDKHIPRVSLFVQPIIPKPQEPIQHCRHPDQRQTDGVALDVPWALARRAISSLEPITIVGIYPDQTHKINGAIIPEAFPIVRFIAAAVVRLPYLGQLLGNWS